MYSWAALLSAGWYLLVSFQDAMGSEWSQKPKVIPRTSGAHGKTSAKPRNSHRMAGSGGWRAPACTRATVEGHMSTNFLRQRVLLPPALHYALLPARLFVVATTFSRFGQGQRDEGGGCRQSKNERGFSPSGQGGGSQDSIP